MATTLATGMDLDRGKLREHVARLRREVAVYRLKAAPWLEVELHSAYSQFANELSANLSRGPDDRSPGPRTSHRPN